MPSKPISPKALQQELKVIPDVVFDVVNHLLRQKKSTNGRYISIVINQEEVVDLLVARGVNRDLIFEQSMLDFEDHYRKEGWKVVYDKPAYYENYSANWTFSYDPNS